MPRECPVCATVCVPSSARCDCGHIFNPVQDNLSLGRKSSALIRSGLELIGIVVGVSLLFRLAGWEARNGGRWGLLIGIYRIASGLKLRKRMNR